MTAGAVSVRKMVRGTMFRAIPITALALLWTAQTAQADVLPMQTGRHAGMMAVPLNKSQVLRIDRPFAKALIGNADIADVMPLSSSSVYILGKKPGSTNLTLYDRARNLVAVIDIVVGPDADGLKRQLFEILPAEHVGVRVANESLVLDGRATTPGAAERIQLIAETYAPGKIVNMMSVGAPQQVLLEVRFSEMKRSTVRELGVRTLAFSNTFGNTPTSTGFGSATGGQTPSATYGVPFTTVAGNFNIGPVNINLAIDALEARGLSTTLAEPNLVALSGETASFLAGGEFPIPVAEGSGNGTAGSPTTISIAFKEFGVLLSFTPTVLDDGTISLIVAPEVSAIDPAASITLSSITIPGLKVRRAKTTLELHDGEAFAMAGLIQSDFSNTVREVPLLGRIPILGALFRSTGFSRGETELVITVTPRLVKPVSPDKLLVPTDFTKPTTDAELLLLGGGTEHHVAVPGAAAPSTGVRPGGIDGSYGHIVR